MQTVKLLMFLVFIGLGFGSCRPSEPRSQSTAAPPKPVRAEPEAKTEKPRPKPAQPRGQTDEAKVPAYQLPPLLVGENGDRIQTKKEWENNRRPQILRLFEEHVYGNVPEAKVKTTIKPGKVFKNALQGKARRREVTIEFRGNDRTLTMSVLIYLPAAAKKPSPLFLACNFFGNHSIDPDPQITLSKNWMIDRKKFGIINHRATEAARGARAVRWPVERILERGYGLATVYYGDLDPDFDDGFKNGIHPIFYKKGQTKPGPSEWGAIGAWAYGLQRAMDYFEQDDAIDHRRVAVLGHSRLGKTALWAGATDPRFAMVVSNNSGCGGAAIFRRQFGETVAAINRSFPHWFNDNFNQYDHRESELPVDQHMLVALIAPRLVYVASASLDSWADPKGEFLAAKHAVPVYELYGQTPFPAAEMPGLNAPAMGDKIGYHIREGKHNLAPYDWERYMDFADRNLKQ